MRQIKNEKVLKYLKIDILIAILFCGLVFLINACHKQAVYPIDKNGDLIGISKTWFENDIVSKEKELIATYPSGQLPLAHKFNRI